MGQALLLLGFCGVKVAIYCPGTINYQESRNSRNAIERLDTRISYPTMGFGTEFEEQNDISDNFAQERFKLLPTHPRLVANRPGEQ